MGKKTFTTELAYTQPIPVVSCSDLPRVERIMDALGTVRAVTYNKIGSVAWWGQSWMGAAKLVRPICSPDSVGLDKARKLWEWAVNDAAKAISAQQEAAKVFLVREIWRKCPVTSTEKDRNAWMGKKPNKAKRLEGEKKFPPEVRELERVRLIHLLWNNPTADNWLHRKFRNQYQRGHTYQGNQIVYQDAGYTAKRLTRNTVELSLNSDERKVKIILKLKCRHVPSGQIRLIKNEFGSLEIHCVRYRTLTKPEGKPTKKIGLDKGYTEGFYTSEGVPIAKGLGVLLTAKSSRQVKENRNRYRLFQHAEKKGGKTASNIHQFNLTSRKKRRKLAASKATVKNLIRKDLRSNITSPVHIFAEDLSSPIKGKKQAKRINRKLNQWMKAELQDSLEIIAKETGSTVTVVNPAYTSQVDSQTGTLLGQRKGDCFTRYTGDVLQADKNAAMNICHRGSDTEITRWMKYDKVRSILIERTVRYLGSIGTTVAEALNLGWFSSKFKASAIICEARLSPHGV